MKVLIHDTLLNLDKSTKLDRLLYKETAHGVSNDFAQCMTFLKTGSLSLIIQYLQNKIRLPTN